MIDTLKVARRLRDAGFSEPQADAVVAAVQEAAEGTDAATKGDLVEVQNLLKVDIAEVRTGLKADIAEVRTGLKADIAEVRSELRESELRFEAKLEAVKSDILIRVFSMILGAIVVNIIALVGAMFGVAKLLGH